VKKVLFSILVGAILVNAIVLQMVNFQFVQSVREDTFLPTISTVQELANVNASLTDRVTKARQHVEGLVEENKLLKNSLNESITMLKDEIEKNNGLEETIDSLNERVRDLELQLENEKGGTCENSTP